MAYNLAYLHFNGCFPGDLGSAEPPQFFPSFILEEILRDKWQRFYGLDVIAVSKLTVTQH